MLIIPKKSRPQLSPFSQVEILKGIRIDSREEEKKNSTERDDDEEKLQIQWARTQHFQLVSKRSPLFDIDPSTAGRRSIT